MLVQIDACLSACRDNAARLYTALEQTTWGAQHAKLVVMTSDGLAAPALDYDILQPITPLAVETWADFSARLPHSRQVGLGGGADGT